MSPAIIDAQAPQVEEPAKHGEHEGEPNLAIVIERDQAGIPRTATVLIANKSNASMCIQRNYNTSTRLYAYEGAGAIESPHAFEGRPILGCHEFAPGDQREVTYDLQYLFAPDASARFCYRLRWTRGGYTEDNLGLEAVVCGA